MFTVWDRRECLLFPRLVVGQVELTCCTNDCLNTHITCLSSYPPLCTWEMFACELCSVECEQGLKWNGGSVYLTVSLLCFYTLTCALCVDSKGFVKTVCVTVQWQLWYITAQHTSSIFSLHKKLRSADCWWSHTPSVDFCLSATCWLNEELQQTNELWQ